MQWGKNFSDYTEEEKAKTADFFRSFLATMSLSDKVDELVDLEEDHLLWLLDTYTVTEEYEMCQAIKEALQFKSTTK